MVRIRVVVGLVVEIMECDGVVIAGKKKWHQNHWWVVGGH